MEGMFQPNEDKSTGSIMLKEAQSIPTKMRAKTKASLSPPLFNNSSPSLSYSNKSKKGNPRDTNDLRKSKHHFGGRSESGVILHLRDPKESVRNLSELSGVPANWKGTKLTYEN